MPTIARVGPYRFFFYSDERGEPAHIHVERDDRKAKFWIVPVILASSGGFRGPELRNIERLVEEHQWAFKKVWDDYFGTTSGRASY